MEKEQKKYLLKGDISGIQEFIFNVQSDGAAKTLKAKSYYVQILGRLACKFVLGMLKTAELFYEGGGVFFIKFEAVDDNQAELEIDKIRSILNENQRYEDLLIHLSYIDIDGDDFWLKLREHSNKEKLRFFANDIHYFETYTKQEEVEISQLPQIERWLSKLSEIRSESNQFKALTEIMVKKKNILVKLLGVEFDKDDANFRDSLVNKLPFWKDYIEKDNYEVYRKKNIDVYPDNHHLKDYNIIDFDALGDFAAHRTGTGKIGILKLDVDNLGKLFGSAGYDMAHKYSKVFSQFFTETIYKSLYETKKFGLVGNSKEHYKSNIYPIFAGGDDCFIIGGWDAVLCFAKGLHDLFGNDSAIKSIKLDNKPITFSAGIVLIDPTHPVRNFSELTENALSQAKSSGKNKVSVFGLSFSWSEYKHILETSKLIADEMITNNINRSYLDKIRKSAKGFNALQNKDGIEFDRIYKLKYYLSKNDKNLGDIVENLFEPYYKVLLDRLLGKNDKQYDVAIYPAIARITEFLTKTRLNYEC